MLALVFLLCLVLPVVGTPGMDPGPWTAAVRAQETSAAASPEASAATAATAATASEADLVELLERDWRITRSGDVLELTLREPFRGAERVTLDGDTVEVDGSSYPDRTVRDWLGPLADPVLRLAALPTEARFALVEPVLVEPVLEEPPAPADETGVEAPEGTASEATDAADAAAEAPVAPEAPDGDALGDEIERGEQGAERVRAEVEAETEAALEEAERQREIARRISRAGVAGDEHVDEDEVVEKVVLVGGNAVVDGEVLSDVQVIGGRAEINGQVGGDVTVFGDNIRLGPDSRVGGDVTSIGGRILRSDGARVDGRVQEVDQAFNLDLWPGFPFDGDIFDGDFGRGRWSPWGGFAHLGFELVEVVVLGLLLCLVLAVAPKSVDRARQTIARSPVRVGVVGFLTMVLIVPVLVLVSVLLAISIIGIPILIILWLLVFFIGLPFLIVCFLWGVTAVSEQVGRFASRRFGRDFGGRTATMLVGLVMIAALGLFAAFLDIFSGPVGVIEGIFAFFGELVTFVATMVGFGAVITVLAERWRDRGDTAADAMDDGWSTETPPAGA